MLPEGGVAVGEVFRAGSEGRRKSFTLFFGDTGGGDPESWLMLDDTRRNGVRRSTSPSGMALPPRIGLVCCAMGVRTDEPRLYLEVRR